MTHMIETSENLTTEREKPLVLVADDELIIRRTVEVALDIFGLRVVSTENGRDCLDVLKKGQRPDLLLLDLGMPIMSGIETLQALGKEPRYEDLPIVVLSGKNESNIVRQAIQLGAWDYILKPFDLNEFGRRVCDLIFKPDHKSLQAILEKLHTHDESLFQAPFLKARSAGKDAYPTLEGSTSLCVLVPAGVAPQVLAKLSEEELKGKVQIFRKCSYGWRKVWPRTA